MPDKKKFDIISEKISGLHEKRLGILRMEPSKALDAIINEENPYPVVHSIPEEDFYILMHDSGVHDFLPVIAMANEKQWQYIIDMEIWERDRITIDSLVKWLGILMNADRTRLVQWLMKSKTDILEYFLEKNLEVKIREHDQDPSELGDGFNTFDDVFYFRTKNPYNEEYVLNPDSEEERELLVDGILKGMATIDYPAFQAIILESGSIIAAETEEELFRERNIRLTEKGFLPFDEATGAYQPLSGWETPETGKRTILEPLEDIQPPSFLPKMIASGDRLFRELPFAFDQINLPEDFDLEMAALCNRIIVADQKKVRSREELTQVVAKVCGYISIGMSEIAEKTETRTESVLSEYHILYLFRSGYSRVVRLQTKAKKWIEKSWFRNRNLHLSFWGEEWMGIAGGLLLKRPLFFCNYENGLIYRDFRSGNDLGIAESALDSMIAFDELLMLMDADISLLPVDRQIHQAKPFILTIWANSCMGIKNSDLAIPVNDFESFYSRLFENGAVAHRMKENFIDWLAGKTGVEHSEIYEKSWFVFEKIFSDIESEYKYVEFKDLDHRFMNYFYLRR